MRRKGGNAAAFYSRQLEMPRETGTFIPNRRKISKGYFSNFLIDFL